MMNKIPENILQDISRWILSRTGLHYPPKKWHALEKAAHTTAAALEIDVHAFLESLLSPCPEPRLLDALVTHLTVGETYFLRDKHIFQLLKDHIIHDLVARQLANNGKINILSAGCASGEEPYSIAILIDHAFPAIRKKDINIIGTDINPLFLEKAEKGIYSQWSLRETPEPIMTRYFTPVGDAAFALSDRIRDRVRFCCLNLMEKDYPARLGFREPFHIIFCRNVLMYFDERNRRDVITRLIALTAQNGWLITAPAETGFVHSPALMPVRFANTMLHRKYASAKDIVRQENDCARAFRATAPEQSAPSSRPAAPEPAMIPPPRRRDEKSDIAAYQEAIDLYDQGDYASAVSKLESLMEKITADSPTFLMAPEVMSLLARSNANLGRISEARHWCERAIASEKLNPEIHYLQATILQSAGDIPAAIQSLKQALFLDPDFIMAHFMLGLLTRSPAGEKSLQTARALLKNRDPDDILPFSEGMTAARLSETIAGMIHKQRTSMR